jgi:hypothetical protein
VCALSHRSLQTLLFALYVMTKAARPAAHLAADFLNMHWYAIAASNRSATSQTSMLSRHRIESNM